MEVNASPWDFWVENAISILHSLKVLRSLRPILLAPIEPSSSNPNQEFLQVFDGPRKWDRASVEVHISESTFQKWLHDVPSSGNLLRFFRPVVIFSFRTFFLFPFLTKLVIRF